MAFFKVKVDEKVYSLDRLTLGDGVVLKRRFGLADLEEFSSTDPEVMLGLLTLAISKTDGISITEAEQIASDLDFDAFEALPVDEDEGEKDADPPEADEGGEEAGARAKSGSSGKRPKKPGAQH